MTTIYFIINAVETALLTIFLVQSGSDPSEQVFLGLSTYRLILVSLFSLLTIVFLVLAVLSIKKESRLRQVITGWMHDERKSWWGLIVSTILFFFTLMLLIQDAGVFGNLKNIYTQFQPILSWMFLLCGQLMLIFAVWISFNFNSLYKDPSINITREVGIVWLLFAISSAVKLLLVTPTAYGPVNGDEMEYFSLAYYLSQGNIFQAVDPTHYPPLYPAFLVPAIPFGQYTFDLIKLLNVLLSSSIVFPVYLTARQYLDHKRSLWVTLTACLLPFHLVFPRRIQSENLYLPLFLWAVYLVLSAPKNSRSRFKWDILTGLSLGMLYLTRYVTLAALPAFLLGWWLKSCKTGQNKEPSTKNQFLHFGMVAATGLLIYTPWVIAGMNHGYAFKSMLGLFITAHVENADQLNAGRLLTWILIYSSYLVLMAAPVLHLVILSIRNSLVMKAGVKVRNWFITAVSLITVYSAAVVRHSWRANYNAEMPMKIMGRYFIFLTPLLLVSAAIALPGQGKNKKLSKWQLLFYGILLPGSLITIAYLTIIDKSIIPISAEAINKLGSVDGFLAGILGWRFFAILLCIFILTAISIWKENNNVRRAVLALGIASFYLIGIPEYYNDLQAEQEYTFIGKQISQELTDLHPRDYQTRDIRFYLPNSLTSYEKQLIYMSIQIRGFHYLTPYSYNASKPVPDIAEDTVILWEKDQPQNTDIEAAEIINLSGQPYQLAIY